MKQDLGTPRDRRATTADLSWMLWTAIGIGGIWVAVLLSLLAPDLVSGSQQDHLPIAAFTTWFWGAVGTLVLLWAMGRLRMVQPGRSGRSAAGWRLLRACGNTSERQRQPARAALSRRRDRPWQCPRTPTPTTPRSSTATLSPS